MGPLAIIIVIELIFTTGIAVFPHKIANVLGIQKLAQVDDTSSAPADTSSAPADATTNSESTPTTAPAPADQTSTIPTSDQTNTPAQTNAEKPSPTEAPTPTPQQTPEGQVSNPTPAPAENTVTQTQAVLSPDDLINSPENISSKSIDEAKNEEEKLTQTTDPAEQTNLLINFATDKVSDMNNFTKADDFASTNFAAQRFNDQIDQAISNLDKLPPNQQASFRKQMVNFCDQADKVLRTVALSVPEESEQDLQIARGQCQELSL